jgi:hypothetical protein
VGEIDMEYFRTGAGRRDDDGGEAMKLQGCGQDWTFAKRNDAVLQKPLTFRPLIPVVDGRAFTE